MMIEAVDKETKINLGAIDIRSSGKKGFINDNHADHPDS